MQTINILCCQILKILNVEAFTRLCTKDFQKNKGTTAGKKNIVHFISGRFTNAIGKFLFVKKKSPTTEAKLQVELDYPNFMSCAL